MYLYSSTKFKKQTDELITHYPQKSAALLPLLWIIQEEEGCISDAAVEFAAQQLELSAAEVLGVVTFYTMFSREPLAKYHIQVCNGVCCRLRGADWLINYLQEKLAITVGQTSGNKLFQLSLVECLGSCGTAPMMQINQDYYEALDAKKVDQILEGLK